MIAGESGPPAGLFVNLARGRRHTDGFQGRGGRLGVTFETKKAQSKNLRKICGIAVIKKLPQAII